MQKYETAGAVERQLEELRLRVRQRNAAELAWQESQLDIEVIPDNVIRLKVGDRCGNTCWFCHNEGTMVLNSTRGIAE